MNKLKFLIFLLIVASCKNHQENNPVENLEKEGESVEIKYAKGFSIRKFNNYSIVTVEGPWPDAEKSFRYILAEKGAKISDNIQYDHRIEVPVEDIVVTSTTHIPALEALGEENNLAGFPGLDYISSTIIRQRIKSGEIRELGKNENINTEVLIDLQPEVVIGFAIDGNNKSLEKIQNIGIPVVFNGDWTEKNPLGKAEWIKLFGALFDKNEEAEEIFRNIDSTYAAAKKLAQSAQTRPEVLSGAMYKDQWYLPHGNSWQAKFIKDANAEYIYSDTRGNGSFSLSFEHVLEKAQTADFWLSAGQYTSYNQLLNESQHYNQFKAVEEKNVYSVSLAKGETGGVLYFELGPQRPDLVLKDHISIFHPDLLPNYERIFFKALKE